MKTSWNPSLPPFRAHKQEVFSELVTTGQFIYQIGESKELREKSQVVNVKDITTEAFQKKVVYLKECFLRYREITGMGRGIAAVQVGIPEQFLAVYTPKEKEKFIIMVNPVITKSSSENLRYPEICMSASPLIAPVVRPEWVEAEYLNHEAKKCLWKTKANSVQGRTLNRVIQHEIDHLNGILNIDRVDSSTLEYALDPTFYEKASFEKV